jgi:hypothetical protein
MKFHLYYSEVGQTLSNSPFPPHVILRHRDPLEAYMPQKATWPLRNAQSVEKSGHGAGPLFSHL